MRSLKMVPSHHRAEHFVDMATTPYKYVENSWASSRKVTKKHERDSYVVTGLCKPLAGRPAIETLTDN